jgi:hypothetical protein
MIANLYYMISIFGGGLFFTPAMLAGTNAEWLTYLGYILPHSYVAQFNMVAFGGMYTGAWLDSSLVSAWDFSNVDQLVRFVAPLTLAPIFLGTGLKLFSWEN